MKIREIKPTILKPMEAAAADPQQILRVAAYCRTSTDREEQETSFEAQKTHFTSVIEANPNWKLVDIYADEESGTRVYKRENFLRMIKDCEDGKIDLILAKSISRFARNTLDSLRFLRKLESLGVVIIFTKEGINTSDKSGELLISVMSAIAQQESASISQNVQLGLRYHFQEGKGFVFAYVSSFDGTDETDVHWYEEPAGNGAFGVAGQQYFNSLTKDVDTILLETTVTDFLFNEDGTIAGVTGTRYDGATVNVKAKAVILATGGFAGSAELQQDAAV